MAATPIAVSPTLGKEEGEGDRGDSDGGFMDSSVPGGLTLGAGVEEIVKVLVRPEVAVPDERKDLGPARGMTREQAYLGQVEVLELVGLGVHRGLLLGEGDRIVEAVRTPQGHPLLVDEPLVAWSSEQASDRVPLRSGRVFGHRARVDRDCPHPRYAPRPRPRTGPAGQPTLIERIV